MVDRGTLFLGHTAKQFATLYEARFTGATLAGQNAKSRSVEHISACWRLVSSGRLKQHLPSRCVDLPRHLGRIGRYRSIEPMVHLHFFRLIGFAVMPVEQVWFIMKLLQSELGRWWQRRRTVTVGRRISPFACELADLDPVRSTTLPPPLLKAQGGGTVVAVAAAGATPRVDTTPRDNLYRVQIKFDLAPASPHMDAAQTSIFGQAGSLLGHGLAHANATAARDNGPMARASRHAVTSSSGRRATFALMLGALRSYGMARPAATPGVSPVARSGPQYAIRGAGILKDGRPVVRGGANAMHTFGGTSDDMPPRGGTHRARVHPGPATAAAKGEPAVASGDRSAYYHPLRGIVDRNRVNGLVTILCPFGWVGTRLFGRNPSEQHFFEAYGERMRAMASELKDEPDVWIEVWNEPYARNGAARSRR